MTSPDFTPSNNADVNSEHLTRIYHIDTSATPVLFVSKSIHPSTLAALLLAAQAEQTTLLEFLIDSAWDKARCFYKPVVEVPCAILEK